MINILRYLGIAGTFLILIVGALMVVVVAGNFLYQHRSDLQPFMVGAFVFAWMGLAWFLQSRRFLE